MSRATSVMLAGIGALAGCVTEPTVDPEHASAAAGEILTCGSSFPSSLGDFQDGSWTAYRNVGFQTPLHEVVTIRFRGKYHPLHGAVVNVRDEFGTMVQQGTYDVPDTYELHTDEAVALAKRGARDFVVDFSTTFWAHAYRPYRIEVGFADSDDVFVGEDPPKPGSAEGRGEPVYSQAHGAIEVTTTCSGPVSCTDGARTGTCRHILACSGETLPRSALPAGSPGCPGPAAVQCCLPRVEAALDAPSIEPVDDAMCLGGNGCFCDCGAPDPDCAPDECSVPDR